MASQIRTTTLPGSRQSMEQSLRRGECGRVVVVLPLCSQPLSKDIHILIVYKLDHGNITFTCSRSCCRCCPASHLFRCCGCCCYCYCVFCCCMLFIYLFSLILVCFFGLIILGYCVMALLIACLLRLVLSHFSCSSVILPYRRYLTLLKWLMFFFLCRNHLQAFHS